MYVNGTAKRPSQSFAYEKRGDSAVILRCFSRDTCARIPESLDGCPVTEVAPYAFSSHMDEKKMEKGIAEGQIQVFVPELMQMQGEERPYETVPVLAGNRLEEVFLPHTIRRVGKYCFYNCANLHRLSFCGGLQDWGSGVFTGCHQVRELSVFTDQENRSSMKQVLDEIHEEVTVDYHTADGQCAALVFPEFYEEGVENTPARILEEKIHGSGMMYRNCIAAGKMDFGQYDMRLSHAISLESQEMVARLVMGRLRFPVGLSEKAKKIYETYVRENGTVFADLFLEERDMDGIRWLLSLYEDGEDGGRLLAYMTEEASAKQFAEAAGYLMQFGHARRSVRRRRMEL